MNEAMKEILRFAFEDVGVESISLDPTEGNTASIKLATRHGFQFTHRSTTESKPQLWHTLTRDTWASVHAVPQPGPTDRWGGKLVCRWCLNPGAEELVKCGYCDWGRWCSRECQRADWVWIGGHRSQGGCRMRM